MKDYAMGREWDVQKYGVGETVRVDLPHMGEIEQCQKTTIWNDKLKEAEDVLMYKIKFFSGCWAWVTEDYLTSEKEFTEALKEEK